jgi:hypothetical protein
VDSCPSSGWDLPQEQEAPRASRDPRALQDVELSTGVQNANGSKDPPLSGQYDEAPLLEAVAQAASSEADSDVGIRI